MAKDDPLERRSATLGLRVALCYALRRTGWNDGGKGEGVGTPPYLRRVRVAWSWRMIRCLVKEDIAESQYAEMLR